MKGIDEARKLYFDAGADMIHSCFPEQEYRIAVGFSGHGSECFGFDDEISRDHDFDPGFCLWLTDEDDVRIGPRLSSAYREILPRGSGSGFDSKRSALGEKKTGVQRISLFYLRYTGSHGAPESWQQWLSIPSFALAEATNGEVWRDDLGCFTGIREDLLHGMPEDVRKKKLSACAIRMAQSGQYNYDRCLKHGEPGAAQLAADEFVRNAAETVFLLNRAHAPYYKWLFRKMGTLEKLSELRYALEFILTGENDPGLKTGVIEDVCAQIIKELTLQGLTDSPSDYLEPHAYEIQERIHNREIRALHIMEG